MVSFLPICIYHHVVINFPSVVSFRCCIGIHYWWLRSARNKSKRESFVTHMQLILFTFPNVTWKMSNCNVTVKLICSILWRSTNDSKIDHDDFTVKSRGMSLESRNGTKSQMPPLGHHCDCDHLGRLWRHIDCAVDWIC